MILLSIFFVNFFCGVSGVGRCGDGVLGMLLVLSVVML